MALKTVGRNPCIGVAPITKFFTTGVAGGAVFQALFLDPNAFPHRKLSIILEKIHVIAAHPLHGFDTRFAFGQLQLQGV